MPRIGAKRDVGDAVIVDTGLPLIAIKDGVQAVQGYCVKENLAYVDAPIASQDEMLDDIIPRRRDRHGPGA